MSTTWSEAEDMLLRSAYTQGGTAAARVSLPYRSEDAIRQRASSLGLVGPRWIGGPARRETAAVMPPERLVFCPRGCYTTKGGPAKLVHNYDEVYCLCCGYRPANGWGSTY